MVGKRIHALALGGVLALVLTGAPAAKDRDAAKPGPQTWYASSVARSNDQLVITHYWSKGTRLRAETVAAGRRIIQIVDATTYYVIDPTRADAIAIERSPLSVTGDGKRGRPFADELEVILRSGGEKVGEEEIGGLEVERHQLTNAAGQVKVWSRTDLALPIRVERYIASTKEFEKIDYVNWLRGLPIDDAFFAPPANIEIERIDYDDYISRSMTERLGPAPPFYAHLLHGEPEE